MKDAPAFDFYPERWLVGTAAMSDAEQLAYLRLLCHQWTMDGLPSDVATLKRLAGKGVTDTVLEKFPETEGKRRNSRLEIIRQEQRKRIIKSREKIEKMNAARGSTRSSTRETTRPLLSASSPLTTHHLLLEKEAKAPASPPPAAKHSGKRQQIQSDISEANGESIPLELNNPDFRVAWADWCLHRASLYRSNPAKRWTALAARKTLAECARYGADIAVMAITAAISNGWQGLVWDRLQPSQNQKNGTGNDRTTTRPTVTRNAEPLIAQPSLNTSGNHGGKVSGLPNGGRPHIDENGDECW